MAAPKHQFRLNHNGEQDPQGRLFMCPTSARLTDLSGVRLLNCSVDTVRQLYRGTLRAAVLSLFERSGMVEFAGYSWHAGRVGRDSGYQFKLQNAHLGIVLLVKNFNVADDERGPHLKIEVSPHLIEQVTPGQLQGLMDGLADWALDEWEPHQCAVHLALDVQGWTPQADMVARMHCRSRRVREISGINSVDWAATASVYGDGETFMWGSAAGLQCSIYNKTLQARSIDKLDYWQALWRSFDNPFDADDPANYNPKETVWRIELRFHHSVVQQFAAGSRDLETGEAIGTCTFEELAPHLDGLWRYGMQSFRLLDRPGLYAAAWTLFGLDARVRTGVDSLVDDTDYRRYYKTAAGFSGKNVELLMGNLVSIASRQGIGAKKTFEQLKAWICWPTVLEHYELKGKTERDIYRWVRDKLQERTIRWGKAI